MFFSELQRDDAVGAILRRHIEVTIGIDPSLRRNRSGGQRQVDRAVEAGTGRIEVEARPLGDDPLRLLEAIGIRLGEQRQQPVLPIAHRRAVDWPRHREIPPSRTCSSCMKSMSECSVRRSVKTCCV